MGWEVFLILGGLAGAGVVYYLKKPKPPKKVPKPAKRVLVCIL
jgi:hypothetical protein